MLPHEVGMTLGQSLTLPENSNATKRSGQGISLGLFRYLAKEWDTKTSSSTQHKFRPQLLCSATEILNRSHLEVWLLIRVSDHESFLRILV